MSYVISDPCLTEGPACGKCQEVCPTDAIHGGPGYAYVDEVYCIDCGACLQVCPTGVIYTTEPIFARGHFMRMLPRVRQYVAGLNTTLSAAHAHT
jgi:Fe-S-cluster-containing hydrogenase component 2